MDLVCVIGEEAMQTKACVLCGGDVGGETEGSVPEELWQKPPRCGLEPLG